MDNEIDSPPIIPSSEAQPTAESVNTEGNQLADRVDKALEKPKRPGRKQADILIEIADAASLFHDRDGNCYADVEIDGHRETWSIKSKGFRRWLVQSHFKKTQTAPNSEAIGTALAVIEANAHFNSPEQVVHIRTAEHSGKCYLDLCNDSWQAVEIDADGWRVIDRPPVRFRRARGMQALPVPSTGGNIGVLREFVNVATDEDFVLAVTWTLAALRSKGPYPGIVPVGEQGSGKSTITRILRALIDPNKALLRTQPRDERDLCITANNSWVIATDNVSSLPGWLSDAYCRLATGGGFATRELYTDQDETIFDSTRPIILNGIEDFVTKPDLADRAILLTLQPIPEEKRRSEDKLWSDFDRAHPQILGALLDIMVHGLRELPNTKLASLPRMADFAIWGTACEAAVWPAGTFAKAYTGNREQAVATVIEADAVASSLINFMAARTEWRGSASELLPQLAASTSEPITKSKDWPATSDRLSNRLRRAAPNLRKVGLTVEFKREGKARTRTITLRPTRPVRQRETPSAASAASAVNNFNDLERTPGRTLTDDADLGVRPTVRHNLLKSNEEDAADAADAKKPTQSGADNNGGLSSSVAASKGGNGRNGQSHTCQRCNGTPDGTERERLIGGETVWLHPKCERFWRTDDGWGRRQ